MAVSQSLVPASAPSITSRGSRLAAVEAENQRLAGLVERLLAVQERTLVAVDRLTPPAPLIAAQSARPISAPVLRVVR
jgi:hypothetical protein